MKSGIHPTYHNDAVIQCVCGAVYPAGSSKERVDIELCAACHPFFTGQQKIVDTARRVEKFTERTTSKQDAVLTSKEKAAKKAERAQAKAAKKANSTTIKSVRV